MCEPQTIAFVTSPSGERGFHSWKKTLLGNHEDESYHLLSSPVGAAAASPAPESLMLGAERGRDAGGSRQCCVTTRGVLFIDGHLAERLAHTKQ